MGGRTGGPRDDCERESSMQCSDCKGEQKLRESNEILIDDGRAEGEAGDGGKKGGREEGRGGA